MASERMEPEDDRTNGASEARSSRPWLQALSLALAVAVCYANSLRVPFLFDDPLPESRLDYSTRPLVWATFALNRLISGADTWSYHLFNALVHLGCGLLLLGVLRRAAAQIAPRVASDARDRLAFVTALLWLCHPLQTESVTYLSQRAEALAALFYLAFLYAFLRSTSAARAWGWQALALLALALGFATKEIIATAPPLAWLYDTIFVAGGPLRALRLRKAFYGALALATAVLFFVFIAPQRFAEGSSAGLRLEKFGPLEYARTQSGVILHYLALALWPHPLCLDYGWPIAKTPAEYLPQTLVVGTLLLAALVLLVRRSWIGFA